MPRSLLALLALLALHAHAQGLPEPDTSLTLKAEQLEILPLVELPTHPPRVLKLDLTRDPDEIWDKLRRGFAMPDLDSPLVTERQAFYLNRPQFLKSVFERGALYLFHIVEAVERRGLPMELALLPLVESNYNPLAYSHAHAAGLWQFIPSTARNFNLTLDKWVDERRDVVASTEAALDYLEYVYEMFGDWHLALAAYNWGEGALSRGLRRNREAGQPLEYLHLSMPEETRNYVPKLQAFKNIVMQPELFGFELPYVPNERYFVAVDVPEGLDLASAANMAGMQVDEFIALNPGFNRPVVIASGRQLVLPVEHAGRFRSALEAREHGAWRTHVLGRGESIDSLARSFGITPSQLRQINALESGAQAQSGQILLVPDGADPGRAVEAVRAMRGLNAR